jgi:hypothetical protein
MAGVRVVSRVISTYSASEVNPTGNGGPKEIFAVGLYP